MVFSGVANSAYIDLVYRASPSCSVEGKVFLMATNQEARRGEASNIVLFCGVG